MIVSPGSDASISSPISSGDDMSIGTSSSSDNAGPTSSGDDMSMSAS